MDPVTKVSKPFGFCTWQSARGALCALEVLPEVQIEDGNLELKPGKVTEKALESWRSGGHLFDAESEFAASRVRVQAVVSEREALPERTKEVLKLEAERMQKRQRRPAADRENDAAKEASRVEDAMKRQRERRAAERERHLVEQRQLEERATHLQDQWEAREESVARQRERRAEEIAEELQQRRPMLEPQGESGLLARRARVREKRRSVGREKREDEESRQSRLMFSGSAALLRVEEPREDSLGGIKAPPGLFAAQEAEDEAEAHLTSQQAQGRTRGLFVPDGSDKLYRRKLTAADIEGIVNSIPSNAAALYAQPVDWTFLVAIGALKDTAKVHEFVFKSIKELVGEMKDMVDFIMALLQRGVSPQDLESKMKLVLAEDAPTFVIKLWRFLVFLQKSEKLQRE